MRALLSAECISRLLSVSEVREKTANAAYIRLDEEDVECFPRSQWRRFTGTVGRKFCV